MYAWVKNYLARQNTKRKNRLECTLAKLKAKEEFYDNFLMSVTEGPGRWVMALADIKARIAGIEKELQQLQQ